MQLEPERLDDFQISPRIFKVCWTKSFFSLVKCAIYHRKNFYHNIQTFCKCKVTGELSTTFLRTTVKVFTTLQASLDKYRHFEENQLVFALSCTNFHKKTHQLNIQTLCNCEVIEKPGTINSSSLYCKDFHNVTSLIYI